MRTARVRWFVVLSFGLVLGSRGMAQGNSRPNPPNITEPTVIFAQLSPYDVHMETAPFSDPDPGDRHAASDWEIWSTGPSLRIWSALGVTGTGKLHIHLGDGTFEGSHAGRSFLLPATRYDVRVRHMDDSGDPATQWSGRTTRLFDTVATQQPSPLALDDIAAAPDPRWTDPAGAPIDLPVGTRMPSLRVETATAQLLVRIEGLAGPGNLITNPPALALHEAVRVVIDAGNIGGNLVLPETDLDVFEHGCEAVTIRLPAVNLVPSQVAAFWVSLEGATYLGNILQTTPDLRFPARGLLAPFVVREAGFSVEVVATGFRLPVNIAFVPNPGPQPGDPYFYVTELYGSVRMVTRDGSVSTYVAGLLNYVPSGAFPGSGEQGLTGIAVDPASGDVFVAMLHQDPVTGANDPRVVRMSSTDGGRTAAMQQVILAMPGETQGPSHQISRLEIVSGELYCHMGDGFDSATARSLSSFRGKILRLNLDGSPVATNPYFNGGTRDARDYVFAYGVRNPFGGAWRAADNARYVVENGPSTDRFAKLVVGRDYRWDGNDYSMRNFALYNWAPATGPVNLAFIQSATFGGSGFPAHKLGHAFVTESGATYGLGRQARGKSITEFVLDAAGNRVSGPIPFVEYVGDGRATVVGLAAGPDGLYFTELYKDTNTSGPTATGGRVLRVRFGVAPDCNGNGEADWCEIANGSTPDCNGNGVPDSCDLALGASTDFDGNSVPDECDALQESRDAVSIATRDRIDFTLRAGLARAGHSYALVGAIGGTRPGTVLEGILLPLNIVGDPWFFLTVVAANGPELPGSIGVLDGAGRGAAALVLPRHVPPILAGATLHHAYVTLDPALGAFAFASGAVPLRLTP